jgi:hypothetical protein
MIIAGKKRKSRHSGWLGWLILLILLTFLVFRKIKVNAPANIDPVVTNFAINCGAENISGDFFVDNGFQFSGANTQSDRKSKSGTYSSMVTGSDKTGFSYVIANPVPGTTYKAEVWRRGEEMQSGILAVSSENPDEFYKETGQEIKNDDDWWQKLELTFTIPNQFDIKEVSVYVYKSEGEKPIYFDDFSIMEIESSSIETNDFNSSMLQLYIDSEGGQKLREIRRRVIRDGVYRKEDNDWIKAKIINRDNELTVNLRPKGDWPDHITGVHPSYRIRTKSEESWAGLQNFSIQHPKTRGYLLEWLFHEFLKSENILSTTYDFVKVKINKQDPIVYALEGHFDKILLESQQRREGPIIKFTEDHFWDAYYVSRKMRRTGPSGDVGFNSYWSSRILPFKEKKFKTNENLKNQFEIGQNLMNEFKTHSKSLSEIFDMDRMAKYLALSELSIAHHGLVWHNQRFYYNPVTSLLEPIGFDAYGNTTPEKNYNELYSKKVYQRNWVVYEPMEKLFFNPVFVSKFFRYLNKYSSDEWFSLSMSKLEEDIERKEKFLQSQYSDYTFDRTNLNDRVLKIRTELFPFNEIVKVHSVETTSDSLSILIQNLFHFPLEIIATGTNAYDGKQNMEYPIMLFPQQKNKRAKYDTLVVPGFAEKIFYRLPGTDSIFTSNILPWKKPESKYPRQELLVASNNDNLDFYHEESDRYIVKSGTHNITTPWVIPEGKELFIGPGAHLRFSGEAFIVSYSPVNIQGSPENPVIFEGLDEKSGSITVLQCGDKSTISYTVFNGLNTLDYKGWTLTGAVSFYESDVDISYTIFKNNHCEDALNIIRSDFNIDNSSFLNTAFDAFDADFCKGVVENSIFNLTGNDGADFSGSTVTINDCLFQEIGDKGISVGENSQVKTNRVEINTAVIGFASKDKSTLEINDAEIKNCQTAFSAYQKKPEFGPATIILGEYKITDTKREFLIESSSTLTRK